MSESQFFQFLDDGVSFTSKQAVDYRKIYMPLCGDDAQSLKSAITPYLAGDSKIDKFTYLTKPTSTEDLRVCSRNFYFHIHGYGVVSIVDQSADAHITAGQLWHQVSRTFDDAGVALETLNFVPVSYPTLELMKVTIKNISKSEMVVTPTSCVPLFARSLANKHDHEQVTSLLHRTQQVSEGIITRPTMVFNEEGHTINDVSYYVFGVDQNGYHPTGIFPTFDAFYGEQGTFERPQAIYDQWEPKALNASQIQGKESIGALRFGDITLKPGEHFSYILAMGVSAAEKQPQSMFENFNTEAKFEHALMDTETYWKEKIASITLETGDQNFDGWIKWVTLQPILRRIFGCSFLPDHDYGKGGKGWRDIWQDLLALILIEPESVRDVLINNYAGVRIDGSNATIIGSKPGEFVADRNAISRVWMDHGVWPYMTTLLYINQTGDFDILFETTTYFRDALLERSFRKCSQWSADYGQQLKTRAGDIYEGTILEHILIQNIVQFFNVGEHNIIRLESADWNDGLDMAFEKGESVAFSSMYAGNLQSLAELLEDVKKSRGVTEIVVFRELTELLQVVYGKDVNFDDWRAKKSILVDNYFKAIAEDIEGETVKINIDDLIEDLKSKAQHITQLIRRQEKINVGEDSWYNGYYDNEAKKVEGRVDDTTRMTLTGQVFPIMNGVAEEEDVRAIVKSADIFLRDSDLGGYRLNSDFGVPHYLALGRAFGFAFGTKENGAFFSHMIVMYAYALYARGFVQDAHKVLNSIYNMSIDGSKAQIYPGVPEYFDSNGRGMYHYLTGSASWFVLTFLTQVFGVRGYNGDLVIEPKLVKSQFSKEGEALVSCQFSGHTIKVRYINVNRLDYDAYTIKSVVCEGEEWPITIEGRKAVIPRNVFAGQNQEYLITVTLAEC